MSTREEAAAALRAEIAACDARLLDLIDGLKDVFGPSGTAVVGGKTIKTGSRLTYVRLSSGTEIGRRNEFELGGFNPVAPPRQKEKGRSSLDMLKEEEDAHLAAQAKQTGAAARGRTARRKRA